MYVAEPPSLPFFSYPNARTPARHDTLASGEGCEPERDVGQGRHGKTTSLRRTSTVQANEADPEYAATHHMYPLEMHTYVWHLMQHVVKQTGAHARKQAQPVRSRLAASNSNGLDAPPVRKHTRARGGRCGEGKGTV